ncbi:MAG: hypothetical protein ACYTDY_17065 [Planctomycetota bacterium]|jgi:hypothetical protein
MRRFTYEGEKWSVVESGGGTGVGSRFPPSITSWGVWFFRDSEPDEKIAGRIHTRSVDELTEEQLVRALRVALERRAEDPGEPTSG